jgi:hypothetical protein
LSSASKAAGITGLPHHIRLKSWIAFGLTKRRVDRL